MDTPLYLGIDGGGTSCRARLEDEDGKILGQGLSGPATTRLGMNNALLSIMAAARGAMAQAQLSDDAMARVRAGIGIAGMGRKGVPQFLENWAHPFHSVAFEGDAYTACLGAHQGHDGGIIIIGTGSIAYARRGTETIRLGGYGFPVSDEASGADLGLNALRLALQAVDGRIPSSPLLDAMLNQFSYDPFKVVDWMDAATATDYAAFARMVAQQAEHGDTVAVNLMAEAAAHVGNMVKALNAKGVVNISLLGGLAKYMVQWLPAEIAIKITPAKGDAMAGAILFAKQRQG